MVEYVERINKCTRQITQIAEDLAIVNNSLRKIHHNFDNAINTANKPNEVLDRLLEIQKNKF